MGKELAFIQVFEEKLIFFLIKIVAPPKQRTDLCGKGRVFWKGGFKKLFKKLLEVRWPMERTCVVRGMSFLFTQEMMTNQEVFHKNPFFKLLSKGL